MTSNKLKVIIVSIIILIAIIFIVLFSRKKKESIANNNVEIQTQSMQENDGNFILYDEYGNEKASANVKEALEIYLQDEDYEEKIPLEESGISPEDYTDYSESMNNNE